MTSYWSEFLVIVVAHALAVASPGPDFAIVLKQSLAHGRRAAVWTSLGIGAGLSIHISYCVLGLGWLLHDSPGVLVVLQYLGAAYLAYVGVQALRAPPRTADLNLAAINLAPTDRAACATGFLVNVLNPKAALFFIALFVLRVSPQTPKLIQAAYGAWMTLTSIAWFCFVSVVFTQPAVRGKFLRHGHWIDRTLGVVFLLFALSLARTTLQ
jgi:RhtB (resistance to homoserine/threonine) family protein